MPPQAPSAWQRPILPRVLPFAVYMAFVGAGEILSLLGLGLGPEASSLLYPLKAAATALALLWCLPRCPELRPGDLADLKNTAFSLLTGLVIFFLWINLDLPWARFGDPAPFMPDAAGQGTARAVLLACRFIGAALLVPLAEELFWRSWLIRYIIDKDFLGVPHGTRHLFSFLAVAVLFALEHHLLAAGFLAGIGYNLVLYKTRSVTQCVLSHAVTNAVLGLWVITGGHWEFW